jgi:hypothetical protein
VDEEYIITELGRRIIINTDSLDFSENTKSYEKRKSKKKNDESEDD